MTGGPADGPALSVVIPHLNQPELLERCVAELGRQTDRAAIEVIVVDNGSDQLPAPVAEDRSWVRLMAEPEPGPGPARTTGAGHAASDIVAFIDADCVPRAGWVDNILAAFDRRDGADVISGAVEILPDDPDHLSPVEAYESVWGYRTKMYVERDGYAATLNMAVRRDVFDAVGGFAGIQLAEDVDWGRRATAAGYTIAYDPSIIVATPARENQQQLRRKWDRHIRHDLAEVTSRVDKVRWVIRALIVGVSPLPEIPKLARAPQLDTFGSKVRAFQCLVSIRTYRAKEMLRLLVSGREASAADAWRSGGERADEVEPPASG